MDEGTGLYYDEHGGWTADWEKAHDFPKTSKAVDTAMNLAKERLLLVLKFDDSRLDVIHPLGKPWINPGNSDEAPS